MPSTQWTHRMCGEWVKCENRQTEERERERHSWRCGKANNERKRGEREESQ